ncbi:DUF2141 domain-containing protein [Marinobacter halophilus]|uniref:DUF2141 domain-containing protein n=1 Tax=Marinobacter halophilus TaxID=1323740 RepID=A0A2T1K9S4_9GAMM|nr:DUF2141 domain-containing protein [Marinobacter halophilus]PSF06875.1 hypothetical protein C7H08_17535 [Marinobacter halophilus]GGC76269.1 hypothetical protein GCM10011362_26080 [Marinobacter halophilus]
MRALLSKSNNQKSALTSTAMLTVIRYSMGLRHVALGFVLAFTNLPAVVFAQSSCPGIHVEIPNIKNSTGTIACALFESPAGFPNEFLNSATNIIMIKIRDAQARCSFLDVPPGTYALAVIHDENRDGKLNTNFLGVPTEGYGFSSGAEAAMSAPSFEAASFSYDGQNLDLTIRLNY